VGEGSSEAGELLSTELARSPSRAGDLTRVRRALVDMFPGHLGRLESLRAAAAAHRDFTYARAVEHVARSFDPGAGPLPPPSLAGQTERPGTRGLLMRPSSDAAGDALALVWEGAGSVFARSPSAYAITGAERVMPSATSPLARVYEIAIHLLGVPRVPLFHRRTQGALASTCALLTPASALVTGDVSHDSMELRYVVGVAIASSVPQTALLFGQTEEEASLTWRAILGAFGPTELGRGLDGASGKLAESFWQVIPPRTQRRLQELLATPLDFELVIAAARQSARRVGLFVTGDFGHATRVLLRERGIDSRAAEGEGLQALCAEHASLADLLRLAVSPEYAIARWHTVPPASQRGTFSSGRVGAVR
jgi:hypothetical protein